MFWGAFSIFIFQLCFLSSDLETLSFKFWDPTDTATSQPTVIKIENESKQSSLIEILKLMKNFLIPSALASPEDSDQDQNLSAPSQKTIIFSWFEVPEANYYLIEISKNLNFIDPIVAEKVRTTEFEWSGFEAQVYFYRVAAGQDAGRMGLFSEPQKADLQLLNSIEMSRQLRPGIRIKVKSATHKINMQSEASQQKTSQPTQDPKRAPPKANQPVTLSRQNIHLTGELFWAGGLAINSQKFNDTKAITQNGWTANRFGGQLTFPLSQHGHIRIQGSETQSHWFQNSNQKLQKTLRQKNSLISILKGTLQSNTEMGPFWQSHGIAQRLDSETIQLHTIQQWGLAVHTRYPLFSHWRIRHFIGLGYGDEYYLLRTNNSVLFALNLWGPDTGSTGLEFNLAYGQGQKQMNFIYSEVMYKLGFSF